MEKKFEVEFLRDALGFLYSINEQAREKVLYNISVAQYHNDPRVFKKLDDSLWEFRAESRRLQYRFIAFWDKRDGNNTLVVCTHGFIKKTDRVAIKELERARKIMLLYFNK